jgi:hypothetical protein
MRETFGVARRISEKGHSSVQNGTQKAELHRELWNGIIPNQSRVRTTLNTPETSRLK